MSKAASPLSRSGKRRGKKSVAADALQSGAASDFGDLQVLTIVPCSEEDGGISLDTFDERGGAVPPLSSPRSLEACLRHGVDPDDLVFKQYEDFRESGQGTDVQRERFERHEARRKGKCG